MSLHALANHMATRGRGGDSMLVHMTPEEVHSLQAMALKGGGSLTINPDTGLPEANFLKKLLPAIAGAALNFFAPGVGTAVGSMFGLGAAAGTGIAVGGITSLATGSLSRGLMAGLGAYGGASLAGGVANAGEAALVDSGAPVAENVAGTAVPPVEQVNPSNFGMSSADKMSAGFKAITDSPSTMGNFAKNNWQSGLAAISPIMADQGVQTATKRPDTGMIRNYTFDPYGQTYTSAGDYPASEEDRKATGGIVALAGGGVSDAEIQGWMAANQGADDKTIAAAMQQYGVSTDQLSSAMGYDPSEVAQRYEAATAAPTGSAAAQYAATHGIDINKQISDWALANPNASDALIDQQMQQYGISGADVAQALGTSGGSRAMEWNTLAGNQGLSGLNQNINSWLAANPKATRDEAEAAMRGVDLNEADVRRATGMSLDELFKPKPIVKTATTLLAPGVSGGGNTVRNPNGTITTAPNIPGRPDDGFTGMGQVRDAYTAGGGSLGYVNNAPKNMEEFDQRFNRQTGDSLAAYEYLMGKGVNNNAYPNKSGVEQIMRPYKEVTTGIPAAEGRPTQKYIFQDGRYVENPNYRPLSYNSKGERNVGLTAAEVLKGVQPFKTAADDSGLFDFVDQNNISEAQLAAALNISIAEARARLAAAKKVKDATTKSTTDMNDIYGGSASDGSEGGGGGGVGGVGGAGGPASTSAAAEGDFARGGKVRRMALGGLGALAGGGSASQYNLGSYSDGGRLLRGPGDGVSDSIPATIGNKQPARLADGEFVIPARIVSELGNGSTEAGARKLYAMMDRVQKARGKTTGKKRVATNTRADKYLPA